MIHSLIHSTAVGGVVGTPLATVGDITSAAIVTGVFGVIQLGYNEYIRRTIQRTTSKVEETEVKVRQLDRRRDR